MVNFLKWLDGVIKNGESIQSGSPGLSDSDLLEIHRLLRETFDRVSLDIAGPALEFDRDTGVWAAQVLASACWRTFGDEGLPMLLDCEREPTTPAAHLSADVILRLLPAVYRRAKSRGPSESLVVELEQIARRWPLSGILLNLAGPPTTSPEFAGHPGLQLLYAERFVENPTDDWLPPEGPGREWVERICTERGRLMPVSLAQSGETAIV